MLKCPNTGCERFLAFEISEEGQAIVEENGFYPIGPEERAISEALLNK